MKDLKSLDMLNSFDVRIALTFSNGIPMLSYDWPSKYILAYWFWLLKSLSFLSSSDVNVMIVFQKVSKDIQKRILYMLNLWIRFSIENFQDAHNAFHLNLPHWSSDHKKILPILVDTFSIWVASCSNNEKMSVPDVECPNFLSFWEEFMVGSKKKEQILRRSWFI
jgi:hypothetical protein